MPWVALAFLSALFDSLKNVASKKSLKHIDGYIVGFSLASGTFLFVLPGLSMMEIPSFRGSIFWPTVMLCGILEVTAIILYMLAIQHSDLSITIPMISFTPVFLLITAPFLVGDYPTRHDLIGVLLIVAGTYVLYTRDKTTKGYFAPFKALLQTKGPRLMLVVGIIYSFIPEVDKIGIRNSSPLFWLLVRQGMITLLLLPIMLYKSINSVKHIPHFWKSLVLVGIFNGLALGCALSAIRVAPVFNVIAIKRTGVLLSVLFGCLIFKEQKIKERFTGATIMILGVFFIILF